MPCGERLGSEWFGHTYMPRAGFLVISSSILPFHGSIVFFSPHSFLRSCCDKKSCCIMEWSRFELIVERHVSCPGFHVNIKMIKGFWFVFFLVLRLCLVFVVLRRKVGSRSPTKCTPSDARFGTGAWRCLRWCSPLREWDSRWLGAWQPSAWLWTGDMLLQRFFFFLRVKFYTLQSSCLTLRLSILSSFVCARSIGM